MIKRQFLAALLFLSIQSFAQFNKGQLMINGSAHYYSSKYNTNSNDRIEKINQQQYSGGVSLGYFFSNHFVAGIDGGVGSGRNKIENIDTMRRNYNLGRDNNSWMGAFLRYNQPIYHSKFGVFLRVSGDYELRKYTSKSEYTFVNSPTDIYTSERKGHGYSCSLSPGLFYFVNNRLSLETSIGGISYSLFHMKETSANSFDSYTFKESSFNSSFSISSIWLGVTFYLGKNKNESSTTETNKE